VAKACGPLKSWPVMIKMALHPESLPALVNAFGTATLLLAAGYSVPQLLLLRRGSAAGVSIAGVVNAAISFVAWTGYAVWAADPWLLASSLVGLPGAMASAVLAVRHAVPQAVRQAPRRTARHAARPDAAPADWRLPVVWTSTLAAAVAAQAMGLFPMVPLVIGTSIVWTAAPAVLTVWRSRDVSGVAAGTWLVHAGEGLLYLGYGHAQRQQAATAYGVACLVGSLGVLTRLATARWTVWDRLQQPEPVA
jgi:hypothetical protein